MRSHLLRIKLAFSKEFFNSITLFLACPHAPFDHPDWLFELKYHGFRRWPTVGGRTARLFEEQLRINA